MKNVKISWFILCTLLLGYSVYAVNEEETQKMKDAISSKYLVKPKQERTMLVFSLSNGFKHKCIPYWAEALTLMGQKTGAFKVVHSQDMAIFSPDTLKEFDVICFNNTTGLKPDLSQQKAIMDFIKSGKGIVGVHAATDNFPEWKEGQEMMGGKFTGHPWTSGGTWAVKIDAPAHPLTKMFMGKGFKIKDEIYRTDPPLYSRSKQAVLMSLDMSDEATKKVAQKPEDMDVGISWYKSIGKGRLFYCSLGHNNEVTWNTPVLEHYLAGIQYASGDLTFDDTIAAPAEASVHPDEPSTPTKDTH